MAGDGMRGSIVGIFCEDAQTIIVGVSDCLHCCGKSCCGCCYCGGEGVMAMAATRSLRGVQRLVAQVRHAGAMATQSESSVVRQGSAKVSDRVLEMTAIDEDGQRHPIKGLTGHTLLRTLVERGLFDPERHRLEDITACGGECEVSIANEWLDKLPPRTEDELEVLKDKTHAKHADPHARLGCQIILEPELDGMVVSIAEEKPWRTL